MHPILIYFVLFVNRYFLFQYAEEPLLDSLRVTLDERYTPQMDVIYHVIAKYIIQTLIDGYNGA